MSEFYKFSSGEGDYYPPSPKIIALAKKIIDEITRDMKRELEAELYKTEHFYHNGTHFKMYLQ